MLQILSIISASTFSLFCVSRPPHLQGRRAAKPRVHDQADILLDVRSCRLGVGLTSLKFFRTFKWGTWRATNSWIQKRCNRRELLLSQQGFSQADMRNKIIEHTLEINNGRAYETSHRCKPLLRERKLDTREIGSKIMKRGKGINRLRFLEINC